MKIVSWNINGIRATTTNAHLPKFFKNFDFDVLCLQETKAELKEYPDIYSKNPDFSIVASSAERKGYAGTCTFYRTENPAIKSMTSIGIGEFDNEGRHNILIFDKFILINSYFPNGGRDCGRVDYKLRYSEALAQFALKLKRKHKLPVIIGGDYNTAHHPIDLKNPKANEKTSGFLPQERAWLDHFEKLGFIDIFRHLHKEKKDQYTWWTYRNNCRARNIGWRIDYFFITQDLLPHVLDAKIHPKILGSDHCPISLEFNL